MFTNPVVSADGSDVLYDVFSTFTDDKTVNSYSLVKGVGFSSSSSQDGIVAPSIDCLDSELGKLPPINAIVNALNDATAVSSTSVECPSGNLFKVTVKTFDFALCASDSSGFTMQGGDMDVVVKYLDSPVDIQEPSPFEQDCGTVALPSSTTPIGKSLLTGQPIPNTARSLKAAFDFSFGGLLSCSCKSTPRPCIFIHGMGVEEELPGNLDNFTDYWGDHLPDHAPCCSSMQFTHLNTVNNTWTSAEQQQKVCDRVLAVSDASTDSTISDTIVVTHSMGNLMFAGAIANGRCSLDSSSTWVGLAAPMKGSMCSDFVQESCAGETNVVWEKIGNITGRCPASTALKSLAYQGGNHTTDKLEAAYTAAQDVYKDNVYAAMCSKWYSGIPSVYQAQFWALGTMVPHKSRKNDGMVEFQSCAFGIPDSEFDGSWKSRFYKTRLNHYDMEFLTGDSLLNGEKMPLKWFECLL
ncbi:hypothetical protein PC116_g15493 [Phytophthora cactorum]|nr:hypothetical protein Pcac1_g28194 [Phytophthora cactorum]KAG2812118.1 hypothetical protein PC112_g15318 [Phytophthora cactorum]KAG2855739.1 hypothetical protein PC113_g12198 [Phytophthora cactorum]KAG2924336.1 hypothetical protein PC115_g8663 [Phytophthora cactorum]KAG2935446.1 hypothetical protein PC117_g12364 [Phytophthora cactorum]